MSHFDIDRPFPRAAILGTLGLALLGGCGGGAPPEISALQFSPDSATVGQITIINGTFGFSDDDEDITTLDISLKAPGADEGQVARSPIPSLTGQPEGLAGFAAQLSTPAAGSYLFELWVTDDEGNDSNHLEGTIEAR